jgi:hypothetical protein
LGLAEEIFESTLQSDQFIDCGAHTGQGLVSFHRELPDVLGKLVRIESAGNPSFWTVS